MLEEAIKNNFNKKKIFLLPNPLDIKNIRKNVIPERKRDISQISFLLEG